MRFIEFDGRTPVNTPANSAVPEFESWTQANWEKWLNVSNIHFDKIRGFHQQGKFKERNEYIDKKSMHWGKLDLSPALTPLPR